MSRRGVPAGRRPAPEVLTAEQRQPLLEAALRELRPGGPDEKKRLTGELEALVAGYLDLRLEAGAAPTPAALKRELAGVEKAARTLAGRLGTLSPVALERLTGDATFLLRKPDERAVLGLLTDPRFVGDPEYRHLVTLLGALAGAAGEAAARVKVRPKRRGTADVQERVTRHGYGHPERRLAASCAMMLHEQGVTVSGSPGGAVHRLLVAVYQLATGDLRDAAAGGLEELAKDVGGAAGRWASVLRELTRRGGERGVGITGPGSELWGELREAAARMPYRIDTGRGPDRDGG